MTIFTVDYDNFVVEQRTFNDIANLDAFYYELEDTYGEWYLTNEDAVEAIQSTLGVPVEMIHSIVV